MRYCLFHIFAIFSNGRGSHSGLSICEKIVIAICENLCDIIFVWIHSEVLENWRVHVLSISSNSSRLPSLLPSHINLKNSICRSFWLNMTEFCSAFHEILAFRQNNMLTGSRSLWPNSAIEFDNSENQGPTNALYKISVKYIKWLWRKNWF